MNTQFAAKIIPAFRSSYRVDVSDQIGHGNVWGSELFNVPFRRR